MSKHTPGPWLFDRERGFIIDANGEVIAFVSRVMHGLYPENASMLAAAPEMLEALEAMISPWDGYTDAELKRCYMAGSFETVPLDRILKARSAIAKAKGGAS